MPGSLPIGRHYQLYLDAITSQGALAAGLADIKGADPTAHVLMHGFPHGEKPLQSSYDGLAKAASTAGLVCGAAFGLDTTHVTANEKGKAIASVACRPDCYAVGVDCETHFDTSPTRATEMTQIGLAAREGAPSALLVAQPWPEPLLHSAFPYEEENAFCDVNAYQAYYNDWKKPLGAQRYGHLDPIFAHQWDALNQTRLSNCLRPVLRTIQFEGWSDVIWDLITCLLANPTVIVWCDLGVPNDTKTFWTALHSIDELAKRGFTGTRAVWDFQTASRQAGTYPSTIDGKAGPITLGLLGIRWP